MTPSSKRIFAKNEEISNDTHETQLNNNDLIIGPSGAGKTTGYVIPNLINTLICPTSNTPVHIILLIILTTPPPPTTVSRM